MTMASWWKWISVGIFKYSFKNSTIIRPVGCVATSINLLKMTLELRKVRLWLTDWILIYALCTFPDGWFNKDFADPAKCFYKTCQVAHLDLLKSCLSSFIFLSPEGKLITSYSWANPQSKFNTFRNPESWNTESYGLSNVQHSLWEDWLGGDPGKKMWRVFIDPNSNFSWVRQVGIRIAGVAIAEYCNLGVATGFVIAWCSLKWLPFSDISVSIWAVGWERESL